MKVFKTLLLAVATIALFAACKPKEEAVRVGLDSTAPTFIDGSVNLILTLSGRSSTNVGVTLSVTGNIPSESLTFEKNPSVAAGAVSATVPVTVNPATLEPGNYQATFTITHVDGADINVAKQSVTVELAVEGAPTPTVSFSSYSEAFDDAGKAKAKIALSAAAEEDVTVNFEVVTEYKDYNALPADVLTFTNPVTIPAGTLEKEVEIVVDKTKLSNGVTYYAIISIASVSENAKLAPSTSTQKPTAFIEFFTPITANLRSDWTISFAGEGTVDSSPCHLINAAGVGAEGTYYIFVLSKGFVADNFTDVTEFVQYLEEQIIGPRIGTEYAYAIKTGEQSWPYSVFSVGAYEMWLLGCNEAGHITGDYATGNFNIDATTEQLEAYAKWIGEWKVTRGTLVDKWVITEDYPGGSVFIKGIDGEDSTISDILVSADYDAVNDQIVIYTQDCKIWTYQGTDYIISLLGLYNNSTSLVSGDFDLARISMTAENTATIASGGSVQMSDGTYEITGMTFFGAPEGESNGYVFNKQVFYKWPETMTKIVADNDDPVYNAYLGDWVITRMDSEWDDETTSYVQLGEVNDTLTFAPKIAGNSFYISGFEGYSDIVLEADYDSEKGSFTIKEQKFNIGEYSFGVFGMFNYQSDVYIWDGGAVLCTGTRNGDVISLATGTTGDYGDFLSMQLFQVEGQSYYSFHDDGYVLPNTLTKAVEPSGAPRNKAIKAGRRGGKASLLYKKNRKNAQAGALVRVSAMRGYSVNDNRIVR